MPASLVINIVAKLEARPDQLVFTAITDILVDGALIGLSAALGSGTGLLFEIALPRRWDCSASPPPAS